MKKKLKDLIANAPIRRVGDFCSFMAVPNGEYKGFWGKNGYDNILLLGFDAKDREWVRISDHADVFNIFRGLRAFNLDIPHEYGCPRIWFDDVIHINYEIQISSVNGTIKRKGEEVEG